jgi:hypothetical protein
MLLFRRDMNSRSRSTTLNPILFILLEEAASATYQAPVLVLVVQYFIPRDEAG